MRRLSLFVLAIFLTLQPFVLRAADEGRITGKVVNLTIKKPLPSQEVVLKGWRGNSIALEKKAKTDGEGRFEFSGLKIDEGLSYEVSTQHQGVEYSSDAFALTKDKKEAEITLEVYDLSEDKSKISIPFCHIVLSEGEGGFEVLETFSLMNTGKTAFPNLTLELPKGIENLKLIQGFMECCTQITGNKVIHSMALKPGGYVFSLRYSMKRSERLDLSRTFPFDVKHLSIITRLDTIDVSSPGFQPKRVETVEDKSFYTFPMENVKGGKKVEIVLRTGVKPRSDLPWIIASIAFLLGFGAFFASILRRRYRISEESRAIRSAQRERVLSVLISKLDELKSSGDISDEIYEEFRKTLEGKSRRGTRFRAPFASS
ncbi:carboxypeptidase regulatory-like domain-containing protein [Candidatus Poribacteria bacterium]|nr:carboxypeptidase regulatory-like domain-containing protein [Candidatus Poribacteria bacterium]